MPESSSVGYNVCEWSPDSPSGKVLATELRLVSEGEGGQGNDWNEQHAQSIDLDGITAAVAITRIE